MSFSTWLSTAVTAAKDSRNQGALSLPGTFNTDVTTEVQDFILGMLFNPIPSGGARTTTINNWDTDVAPNIYGAQYDAAVRFVNSLIDKYLDIDRDPNVTNPAPVFTSVTPATGSTAGGETVVIAGKNFKGTVTVTIGGAAATSIVRNSDRKITCVTPARSAGAKDIVVTNSADSQSVTGAGAFTYS